jgi:hypothetical protein
MGDQAKGRRPGGSDPLTISTLAGTTTTRTVAAAVAPGGRPRRSPRAVEYAGARWWRQISSTAQLARTRVSSIRGPTKPARCATRHQAASALGPVNTCGPMPRRAFDVTQMSRCAPVSGLRSGPSFGPDMPGRRLCRLRDESDDPVVARGARSTPDDD